MFNRQVITGVREVIAAAAAEHQISEILFLRFPDKGRAEIVSVAPDGIMLKALQPSSLSVRLESGEPCVVWFESKGALHWFFTKPIRFDRPRREFVLKMPGEVTRLQRRAFFRVQPSASLPVFVKSFAGDNQTKEIQVENISQKGIALSFAEDPQNRFVDGFATFEVDLGKFGLVALHAEVRSKRRTPDHRFFVGMEFIKINTRAEYNLSDYLSARQREDLKKKLGM